MDIAVPVTGPLDAPATLARYRLWGADPCAPLEDGRLLRVARVAGRLEPYAILWSGTVDAPRVAVRLAREVAEPTARRARAAVTRADVTRTEVARVAVAEARRFLGLDVDLAGFYAAVADDPALGPLTRRLHGLRPTLAADPLEMLVGAIAAQQVNLTFAGALRARLVHRFGTRLVVSPAASRAAAGREVWAFPEAATLARVPRTALRRLKFSGRKADYVIGVARALAAGRLDPAALSDRPGEEVVAALTAWHGVGRWTAEWFLARYLGRGDVCPAGDLAVRKAFARYYGRGRPLAEATIRRRARAWGAHQNLAVHYLLAGARLDESRGGGGA